MPDFDVPRLSYEARKREGAGSGSSGVMMFGMARDAKGLIPMLLLLERCSEIERDNHTLVKRMTEIMKRSGTDSKNSVQYRSLNKDRRRQELIKITQENQV